MTPVPFSDPSGIGWALTRRLILLDFQGVFMNRLLPYLFAIPFSAAIATAGAVELPDFVELSKQSGPAVVNISTSQTRTARTRAHGFSMPDLPEGSPLREFFRHFLEENGELPDSEIQSRSLGSGFFVSADGYILTNHHVVSDADEIIVRTSDRREFPATVVGSDRRSDTALLKVDIQGAPVVQIGSAKNLEVGEWVLAIGSPFGFDHSVTAGIVSAKGRSLPTENYVPFIQTDVAINPGNSGGPLIDLDGKVVGVNSQIYSRTGGFMGLSFAVPIDLAMNVADQLRTQGHVSRGWLGVLIQDVTRELAESFGMPHPRGALVSQVLPDSPAQGSDLQVGDVILAFNGRTLMTSSALPPMVGASPVNKSATLRILRDGKEREVEVVIGELPDEDQMPSLGSRMPDKASADRIGLRVQDLTDAQREELGLGETVGVLVEDVKPGPGMEAGIRPGDVVLMLNHQQVNSASQFREAVKSLPDGRSVAVLVQRDAGRLFMALRVPE
jgi:serine protease Do